MEALDGNAIGGLLYDVFGAEMTAKTRTCVHCGATMHVAELIVYMPAPGAVGRCRACEEVVLVIVDVRGTYCVDLQGLAMPSG
jgi:Family of unknown function (DUF6510)